MYLSKGSRRLCVGASSRRRRVRRCASVDDAPLGSNWGLYRLPPSKVAEHRAERQQSLSWWGAPLWR